jgi:uncharacterized repeat protein (TIGR03803 family)
VKLGTLTRLRLALFVAIAVFVGAKHPAAAPIDLYDFGTATNDVMNPQPFGNIALGADMRFYGSAPNGASTGYGGIFRISTAGIEQVKYEFKLTDSPTCQPGLNPGSGGRMYGTCYGVGGSTTIPGIVYEYTPPGTTITPVVCNFDGSANGGNPDGPPILATDGNYYGTTAWGGAYGYGTIYMFTPSGSCTPAIYSFSGPVDGKNPHSLVQEIYTTNRATCTATTPICLVGAAENGGVGSCGTIFQFIPSLHTLTVLYPFTCTPDGQAPVAAMIQPNAGGPLYGTTYAGGVNNNGTVFNITPTGTSTGMYRLMHSFLAASEGAGPQAALLRYYDGDLYGTCIFGGNAGGWQRLGQGSIFKISPVRAFAFTTLYLFNGAVGSNPAGGLVFGPPPRFVKTLYGDTEQGGAHNEGVFYSFLPRR